MEQRTQIDAPLGGRAALMPQARQFQVFGNVAAAGPPQISFVPITQQLNVGNTGKDRDKNCIERLWRIRSSGLEVQRESVGAVAPLTVQQIQNDPPGAAVSQGGTTSFKVRVDANSTSGAYYTFDMDAGQPVELYAASVTAYFIGPANAVEISAPSGTAGAAAAPTRAGFVLDALLSLSLMATEVNTGANEVWLTEKFLLPGNTEFVIPIPHLARKIRISMATGTSAAPWGIFLGNPTITLPDAFQVGQITFDAGGIVSTTESEVLPSATHIRTNNNGVAARFCSITWGIRP